MAQETLFTFRSRRDFSVYFLACDRKCFWGLEFNMFALVFASDRAGRIFYLNRQFACENKLKCD